MTTTTPLTGEARQAKVDKINGLRAKTVANGCTPEEAASATALADQLMAKYGLTDDDFQPETLQSLRDLFNAMAQERAERVAREAAEAQARRDQAYRNEQARRAYAQNSRDTSREAPDEAWEPSAAHGTTTHRKNKSHQNCGHANTSSDRARCRRAGGPFGDSKLF